MQGLIVQHQCRNSYNLCYGSFSLPGCQGCPLFSGPASVAQQQGNAILIWLLAFGVPGISEQPVTLPNLEAELDYAVIEWSHYNKVRMKHVYHKMTGEVKSQLSNQSTTLSLPPPFHTCSCECKESHRFHWLFFLLASRNLAFASWPFSKSKSSKCFGT